MPPPPDPAEVALLRRAISDPFVWVRDVIAAHEAGSTFAVEDWYRLAREKAPLWCFTAWEFKALRTDGLDSSYPLSRIVERLAADERVDLRRMQRDVRHYRAISGLERHLFDRRASLADGGDGAAWVQRADDRLLLGTSTVCLRSAPTLASDYSGIGEEFMYHLEALEGARTKRERDETRGELDAFVDGLGRKLAWGRPTKGPPAHLLEPLFEQGKWLFDVCWAALPAEPSEETKATLEELGSSQQQRKLWAIRLALPMLSVAEIRALRREVKKPRGRYPHVAPRRFTVFCLAHRLGEDVVTLARKLPPTEDARAFFAKAANANPIRG